MSKVVDDRVVEMRFDNKQFESGVRTSMSTLDRLRQSLKLTEASRGLENLNTSVRNVNMSGLSSAVETVQARFSSLQVIGVTSLANIANAAVNAGKRMLSALTIDPIMDGFREYETQMGAVQTILANTKSKGSTLDDVNRALAELNTYADKTIYNFTEMTRNIGTFTAAGVGLDKSVTSIKGIANLAAISGSTSAQASSAMYQLSQALAAGKVSLMDWNSVVNAGMGGEVFQNALKRTATQMGTNVDALIEKYGSFRESLTQGNWLTAEVLTETLTQLSGAYTKADLIAQGYTEKQAEEILDLAKTAESAATEVKTFSQLFDTLKEAVGSGWAQTWQILFGDFEEAKELFTGISNTLGEMIGKSAESRNELLKGWKELGGRKDLIESFKNIFDSLLGVAKPIGEAFRDIFPPITAKQLHSFTAGLKELTSHLKVSEETADKIKRTFKGVFSVFDLVGKGIKAILSPIGELIGGGGLGGLADLFLDITASIGDFFTALNSGAGTGNFFDGISDALSTLASKISELLKSATDGFSGFGDIVSGIGDMISNIAGKIGDALSSVFGWVQENVSGGHIFAGLAGGGIFMLLKSLSGLSDKVKGVFEKGVLGLIFGTGKGGKEKKESPISKITESVSDAFDSLSDSLSAFTSSVKVGSLVTIASAIGILTISLTKLSKLKVGDIAKSLLAMGAMFTMLNLSFKSITKSLDKFDHKGIVKAGFALIGMATAMNIFASAMKKISDIPLDQLASGLVGLGAGLLELVGALKLIEKIDISIKDTVAIVVLAEACKVLGDALAKFSGFSWDEITHGLGAMGGALVELAIALGILSKAGGGGSILGATGILIAVQALDEISENLKRLGELSWDEIGRGLGAMGGALTEFTVALGVLSKVGGSGTIFGAAGLLIAVRSLDEIAENLKRLGGMSWEEIGRGLSAMGGALVEIGFVTGALGKIAGFSGIIGSGSILIAVQGLGDIADALKKFGEMSWDEIKQGLSAMGGALAELSVGNLISGIAGFSGLIGSGSLLLMTQGLDQIANALKKFGEMSWDEIKQGLTSMGLALAELTAGNLISGIGGIASLIGSGSLLMATQGLGDLADALKKFGEMDWDSIGRGLTAMGLAMGETALGGILNTLSGFGAGAIAEIAGPLGTLADSVKKWAGVTVPEGLGLQLGMLASGVRAFTFGGFGADALSTAAAPLGTLADSVKKWAGVVVPEGLGTQLSSLASGVRSFTFAGFGADALSSAAYPLGTLADSVKKWAGVTVPEGMQSKLEGLANGVKAFSFAFMGGWSMAAATGPIGDLAGAVSKWNGVTIQDGLNGKLEGLASGVKSFSFAFVGGWSIDAIKGPLGDLADAVKKWNGITVPEGLQSKLSGLADGVKAFSGITVGNLSSVCEGIKNIGNAAKELSGVNFGSIASGLTSFSTSINSIHISTDAFSGLGKKMVDGLVNAINSGKGRVQAAAVSLGNAAVSSFSRSVSGAASRSSAAGIAMVNGLANGIRSGVGRISSAATNVVTQALNVIRSKSAMFATAGRQIVSNITKGILSGKSSVSSAVTSLVSGASSRLRGYYSSFYSAGTYVASGFANGIRSRINSAASAAAAMASAASAAARKNLGIKSPSRVFKKIGSYVPQGFAIGITKFSGAVEKATNSMTGGAVDGASFAMSRVNDILSGDMDVQPTIRPVMDLSNVESGAAAIDGMFRNQQSVSVMSNVGAISNMMRYRNQNGDSDEIVGAIDKLRRDLGKLERPSYNVNGVTYDDGSNVSDTVDQLIRAIRLERRV